MWLSAAEALRRLNVKPQTLYATVSRGRIRAKADPADPRKSLYSRDDVDRLSRRPIGRPRAEPVAAEAISWGEPVLSSSISTGSGGRLWYRGQDAVVLARQATLEDIAALLWGAFPPAESRRSSDQRESGMSAALLALAGAAGSDLPSLGRAPSLLRADAANVLAMMAGALAGLGEAPIHVRLAQRFGRPQAADDLRCALVLLADHELNVSTFTARVAASPGAALSAGALAALAALSGPLHGRASITIEALVEDTQAAHAPISSALRDWLDEGRSVPGFGHRFYPHGDVRAEALLGRLTLPLAYAEFRV